MILLILITSQKLAVHCEDDEPSLLNCLAPVAKSSSSAKCLYWTSPFFFLHFQIPFRIMTPLHVPLPQLAETAGTGRYLLRLPNEALFWVVVLVFYGS